MSLKKSLQISILVLFLLTTGVQSVLAQDTVEDGVYYVIQSGDTLTRVALRFGVSVDDIITANSIADPNAVYVGTRILIPNIDWIQGELAVNRVPFGETFRSLQRRYQLEKSVMMRLGGLVSPNQLYMGYPLLLPSDQGISFSGARAAVAQSTSLLELALTQDSNPWRIAGENQLRGTWQAIPNDVLFTGKPGTGPGALPSPISQLDISSSVFIQGNTHTITVNASGTPLDLTGTLIDYPLNFFVDENGEYIALQGVHVMLAPGLYPLTISGALSNGAIFSFSQTVFVDEGDYSFETITVDDAFLDDEVSKAENIIVAKIISQATSERMWSTYFVPPSPYSDSFNSFFGTRRSFNGSPFEYYHGGVDYGGGTGVEVFAPAPGKVVFAGPLEIRGNATIIDHGWGIYSGYFHQSEIKVAVGDLVTAGQVIGLVGNTGRSSGAHLHWELWAGGIQVEPLDWLYHLYP